MTTPAGPQAQEAGNRDLLELSEKATPGPWTWRNRSGQIEVAAPHGGGTVVMGFVRDGMRNAQPVFGVTLDGEPRGKRGGILRSAKELIAADPDGELNHPDALFMVAAANWFRANAATLATPARVVSDATLEALLDAISEELVEANVDYPAGRDAGHRIEFNDESMKRALTAALSTLQSGAKGKDGEVARLNALYRWFDSLKHSQAQTVADYMGLSHADVDNIGLFELVNAYMENENTALQPGQEK